MSENTDHYWADNIRLILKLLFIWFLVSFGFSIILVEPLNTIEFAGFQFSVDGAEISGASGGAAEENGFMVSSSVTTVIGFSLSGATIPAGSGLLTILSAEITGEVLLSDIIVSDSGGSALDFEFDDGFLNNYSVAWPIIEKYKIPTTIYLATGYIGTGRRIWTDILENFFMNKNNRLFNF